MGHKVHPKGIRLGYVCDWDSKWFNLKEMPSFIEEDYKIRRYLKNKLKLSFVSKIIIERPGKYLKISIHTSRPGFIIGKGGQGIENLKKDIELMTKKNIFVNIIEIKKPDLDAQLVADNVSLQTEKHLSYKRAMKKAIEKAILAGADGIKIKVSGRLGGAEIARSEWDKAGRIPLQTFRANIDYGFSEASTKLGQIGVKVWIFKGEIRKQKKNNNEFLKSAN
ncbi:MAG: 30S ribosomal protein S3 [Endomicrobium sp.]|nr:30S ribosomal protein S3 [Endomicrobium sp.]